MDVKLIQGKFQDVDIVDSIDLVVADPPDNNGTKYDSYADCLAQAEYEKLLVDWLVKCCCLTSGPVFYTFADKWIPIVEDGIRRNSLKLVQRLWWRWTFGQHNARRYTPSVRPIYWLNSDIVYPDAIRVPSARAAKYGDKRADPRGRMPDNVWDFSRVCGTFRERRKWHKCQLPEKLVDRIILGHSKPGDRVLDPFIGSGTTAYCADANGRHFTGVDQSRFYLDEIQAEITRRREARGASA